MATDNGIYPYTPNGPVCVVMAMLFGISAGFHLFQMIRKKTWFYTPLVVGAIMMTLGYIARYFSAKSPASLGPYIIQSLFIILPPSLYAATIYIIYGRIALFVNAPRASLVQPTRVTRIFVVGDVIAFFMQAGGGGMMAQANMAGLGQKIMLIGLFVQLAFFGFFLVISLIFWRRTRSSSIRYTLRYGRHSWYNLLMLLLAAATLIILRCVFRIIEFGQGHTGYLASHEAFLYLFDAVPMLGVQIMFHLIHAGDVFPPNFNMQKLDDDDDTTHLQDRI
ncbi:hypothetical protein IFR04_015025 [Cadophora malorum]|uniref:RTA1-domain-containing protein n=1 Tax=Cadophora malorum TaxID=108018 RepID=A0A8H7T2L9_9HELO|nr:hypothetical protein IFR04_015025 [Cadophora malorum]